MASIIDTNLLSHFSYLFAFLLILVVVFALLEYKNLLHASTGVNALIALAVAALFLMSRGAVAVIANAAPWFVLLFFFIFMILLLFTIFGTESKDFLSVIKSPEHSYIVTIIVIISIVIIAFSLAQVWGQGLLSKTKPGTAAEEAVAPVNATIGAQIKEVQQQGTATTSFSQNLYATLFHPKVVGLAAVLLIATFTIKYLSSKLT